MPCYRFWGLGDQEPQHPLSAYVPCGATRPCPASASQPPITRPCRATCTHIVHAAGAVRMNLPIEDARRSAVGSAQQIIDLPVRLRQPGRLRRSNSSAPSAWVAALRGVPEDWIDAPREFHNTYEQAKAEAEQLMREHSAHGLPLTVHRPSMVVGDSASGRIMHFQVFYSPVRVPFGAPYPGLYPDRGDARHRHVGCDIVGEASAPPALPETIVHELHLCSGRRAALAEELSMLCARMPSSGIACRVITAAPAVRACLRLAQFGAMNAAPDVRKALPAADLSGLPSRQPGVRRTFFAAGMLAAHGRRARAAPANYLRRCSTSTSTSVRRLIVSRIATRRTHGVPNKKRARLTSNDRAIALPPAPCRGAAGGPRADVRLRQRRGSRSLFPLYDSLAERLCGRGLPGFQRGGCGSRQDRRPPSDSALAIEQGTQLGLRDDTGHRRWGDRHDPRAHGSHSRSQRGTGLRGDRTGSHLRAIQQASAQQGLQAVDRLHRRLRPGKRHRQRPGAGCRRNALR